MKLEPLYRIRFSYPESWMVTLEGGWEQHLFLAEGRCEGAITGRFRGANFPSAEPRRGRFAQTSARSSKPTTVRPSCWNCRGTGVRSTGATSGRGLRHAPQRQSALQPPQ